FQGNAGYSFVGPILLAWLPVTLLGFASFKGYRERSGPLYAYSVLGCLAIGFVNRIARYWLPYLSVIFIAMAWGYSELAGTSKKFRTVLTLMMVVPVMLNVLYGLQTIAVSYDPRHVLIGQETAVEYQSYTHPGMNTLPADILF